MHPVLSCFIWNQKMQKSCQKKTAFSKKQNIKKDWGQSFFSRNPDFDYKVRERRVFPVTELDKLMRCYLWF